jgi:dihydropteroate synthase
MADGPTRWRLVHGRALTLDAPRLLAIVNATPDSFSDGGRFRDASHAADEALRMLDDGADMLDIGGESTRPGAEPVPDDEQVRRVVPIIEALRARGCDAPVSVDTTSAAVARAALDAGADAVNDQSAGREDPGMLLLVGTRGCGLILMHRLRRSNEDSFSHRYGVPGERRAPTYDESGGVVPAVRAFLAGRRLAALKAGVDPEAIALDPGLGFGKTVEQNIALVRATGEFASLGAPVLCAASRKSFVGKLTGVDEPADRADGSVAVAVAMLLAGASLFRVHDIKQHRRALDMAYALVRPGPEDARAREGR